MIGGEEERGRIFQEDPGNICHCHTMSRLTLVI